MQMIISKQIDLRCLLLTLGLFLSAICTTSAQELEPLRPVSKVPYQLDALQDSFLEWPDTTNAYASVDGHRMQTYVVEQQDISRRYRDTVNPQYWGRIIGASSDWESAEWLEQRHRDL